MRGSTGCVRFVTILRRTGTFKTCTVNVSPACPWSAILAVGSSSLWLPLQAQPPARHPHQLEIGSEVRFKATSSNRPGLGIFKRILLFKHDSVNPLISGAGGLCLRRWQVLNRKEVVASDFASSTSSALSTWGLIWQRCGVLPAADPLSAPITSACFGDCDIAVATRHPQ